MDSVKAKQTSARAFIRSLNILLKYARLYSFDHARTAEQFNTAWTELHDAIPVANESGLLLSATGSQLLLDGVPIDSSPAERSFAQLLSAAGLASIQFAPRVSKEDFERFVRAFPTSSTKPSVLAEQLKAALTGVANIKINEIRYVAEDASKSDALAAGLLTAQSLGADAGAVKDWLRDPQKLLQLIVAAEGSRGEPGDGPIGGSAGGAAGEAGNESGGDGNGTAGSGGTGEVAGTGYGTGTGTENTSGGGAHDSESPMSGASPYSGASLTSELIERASPMSPPSIGALQGFGPGVPVAAGPIAPIAPIGVKGSPLRGGSASRGVRGPSDTGSGFSGWNSKDEDILGVLKLLTQLGHNVTGQGDGLQAGPLQEELSKLPPQSQDMMQQALAAVAGQVPATNSKDGMLLRLAEHLAIKFALERYQSGEVKVNAVRKMFEKMSQEIEGLRKILGGHEQKLADAGVIVESTAELLDQQFWAAVPERGKRAVLTSSEAWCIPARNLRRYVEELLQQGDEKTVLEVLQNYASCLGSPEFEARRRAAIGIADLADLYASLEGRPLTPAIRVAGAQLSAERDDTLQGLISAAFVRLAQEAGLRRIFPALLQSLDSLDTVEHQRPVFAQSLRPRIGLDKRVPEFLEDVIRGERVPEGLEILLQRVPRSAAENLILRFNRTTHRADMQRLVDLASAVGEELTASLRDTLRSGAANEASEISGLLSRLDPSVVERLVPERLLEWPRQAQDRTVRLMAMGGAAERGSLLCNFLHMLDPVLLPLTIDEIGLSEDTGCIPTLLHLAGSDAGNSVGPFVRLKAVEALGRLKAQQSAEALRGIAEARHLFHWAHPGELRLAAVQSLAKIDPGWAAEFVLHSGFSAAELAMAPLDPLPNAKYFRRRRYPRVRLTEPVTAVATLGQASYRLELRGLSLSGGIAVGEKHLPPGTLLSLRIGTGLRPIRAQILMRDARAQGLGFEIAEMDLDERARLRKLLLENKPGLNTEEQALVA